MKDILISVFFADLLFGLALATGIWYFRDVPFEAAFWKSYVAFVIIDILCMVANACIRRYRRRAR